MSRRVLLFVLVVVFAVILAVGTWVANRMQEVAESVAALPPRAFETLTVVTVGTGGTYADPLRGGPCVAVGLGESVVLVDAGRGTAEGLRKAEIPVDQPLAVLLTSLLPENTQGLDDLLASGWLAPREAPLQLLGPPGTRALAEGLLAAHARGLAAQGQAYGLPAAGARFAVTELDPAAGERVLGTLRVRAAALPGGPLETLAYRFEPSEPLGADGASVVVGGAAWGAEALVALARDAWLLVHEAHFAESVELAIEAGALDPERMRREASFRTPLERAGETARQAGVKSLALVRLRPPPLFDFQAARVAGRRFAGEILVPEDGDALEAGAEPD